MSIFNQNSPKEDNDELLYQTIKEELKPILEEWDGRCGKIEGVDMHFVDPNRTKMIKDTSEIVMQFIWRKLGMKMPDYTRQVLDKNFNLLKLERTATWKD